MSDISRVADLFQQGRVAEIGSIYGAAMASGERSPAEWAFDVYLALAERENIEGGIQFILSFCQVSSEPTDMMLMLGRRIHDEQQRTAGANLLMHYIMAGGFDPYAYDACITYSASCNLSDSILTLFELAEQRSIELLIPSLFNVATALSARERHLEALVLYQRILKRDPTDAEAGQNLKYLAQHLLIPEAMTFFRQEAQRAALAVPTFEPASSASISPVMEWRADRLEEIEESINVNGFCYLKQGCALTKIEALANVVTRAMKLGSVFPLSFASLRYPAGEEVFEFDAKALISRLMQKSARIDYASSAVRRVNPEKRDSFVPFHQDTTAFTKMLVNIWTPLTPAGGDYPSLQLVRKRISDAEQTRILQGEYNLVEIEESYVFEKYGSLIFDVNDAMPGDCVIFLGTTIHRSFNLDHASKPRMNMELRWI